jgi:hypothetical protein
VLLHAPREGTSFRLSMQSQFGSGGRTTECGQGLSKESESRAMSASESTTRY